MIIKAIICNLIIINLFLKTTILFRSSGILGQIWPLIVIVNTITRQLHSMHADEFFRDIYSFRVNYTLSLQINYR
jgi:hypothetical protein